MTFEKRKISWKELENKGLDENLYNVFDETMKNIEEIHQEVLIIFEKIFLTQSSKQDYKNLVQLATILDKEMNNANSIIDTVLTFSKEE